MTAITKYIPLDMKDNVFKLPDIKYPEDNYQTKDKIELGRHLFYERKLSINNTIACSDCHQQLHGFADTKNYSRGAAGDNTKRNTMSLTNVAYNARYTWADDRIRTLEQQAVVPLTLQHPLEMGFGIKQDEILEQLQQSSYYRDNFNKAFPGEIQPINTNNIIKAIASFERTLISVNSLYDQYISHDNNALSESAKRGLILFYSEKIGCIQCHSGFNFRHALNFRTGPKDDSVAYHNTGLYNIDNGAYPSEDQGLYEITRDLKDMGRFKTPTLRNVAVTAPYMHDGSIATLSEVIDHYARGGRIIYHGPNKGDGKENPYKSHLIKGFTISEQEKKDLISFLESLTDKAFLSNEAFSDPFIADKKNIH